jgi:TonB-dependent SusC/RagA subfamily outer membrane receptor
MPFSSRHLLCSALLLGFASACSSGGGGSTPQTTAPAPEVSKAGQTVTARDVENTPSGSVEKTLEGRFPGVVLLRTPSGGISIRIRGAASVNGQNAPLYVIDGSPVEPGLDGDLPGLNPYDIESIKVLKDAASTTMYGVRGGNGVIVIKTKRPGR